MPEDPFDQAARRGFFQRSMLNLQKINRNGILRTGRMHDDLFIPAWTYTFIHLNEALQQAARLGARCRIKENVQPWPDEEDLTSLVAAARAAACHITSDKNILRAEDGLVRGGFAIFGNQYQGGDPIPGLKLNINPFEDDTLMWVGGVKIFVRRNVEVALNWLASHADAAGAFIGPPPD